MARDGGVGNRERKSSLWKKSERKQRRQKWRDCQGGREGAEGERRRPKGGRLTGGSRGKQRPELTGMTSRSTGVACVCYYYGASRGPAP